MNISLSDCPQLKEFFDDWDERHLNRAITFAATSHDLPAEVEAAAAYDLLIDDFEKYVNWVNGDALNRLGIYGIAGMANSVKRWQQIIDHYGIDRASVDRDYWERVSG